jgi:hypothetical protein
MDRVGDIDSLAGADEILAVGLKMTRAFTAFMSSMKLSEEMGQMAELYREHVAPKMPLGLKKQQVSVTIP